MSIRTPIKVEDYLNNDQMCISVVNKKYLQDGTQLVSECFDSVINNICNVTTEQSEESKQRFVDDVYEDWSTGVWLGAGSIMSGANEVNRKVSIANCSTIVIPEDTIDAILDTKKYATKMAAHRQGFGVGFDALRPRNAPINNSAVVSEGAVHWMASFDKIGEDAGQKSRKPAMLFYLSVNHLDCEEFITCKEDLKAINNANISVHVTDQFMDAVKNDNVWLQSFTLQDGTKMEKIVNARKLFQLICKHAWSTGEPGVQYIDHMKRWSIQEALGHLIRGSNACGEKPMPDQSICCLAPINMAKVPNPYTHPKEFHAFMKSTVTRMVRFMDNVIQFELDHKHKSPTQQQYETVKDLREIGLGILNLHAWFFNNGIVYDSQEAVELTEEFFKWYQYYAFKASCELAVDRGPCPAWQRVSDAGDLKKLETPFLTFLFNEFPDLRELYFTTGIRNGALLSIAPTGSISMFFPKFLSTGIEPLIGYAFWRKTRVFSADQNVYDHFFVFPEIIKQMILPIITDDEDRKLFAEIPASILDNDGKYGLSVIELIKKYVNLDLLKPAHEINPLMKVKLMGACQRWNDAAISVTYNLPYEFTVEQVEELYMAAFDEGLKSIAIYRDGSREGIYIFEDPLTYAKKFDKLAPNPGKCKERPSDIQFHCAPKRPEVMDCDIHHCQIKGDKWIVLIGMLKGKPYELFAGKKNDDFNISRNITTGKIVKDKRGVYSLIVPFGKSEIKYSNIAELFMNEEYQAITRLISLALRSGSYYEFIVDQLKKSSNYIGDFGSVVSRCLNKYIKDTYILDTKNACPDCGEGLVNDGGCIKCSNNCGYTRCE